MRSIPTCVGFTRHAEGLPLASAVHPHVRGVYVRPAVSVADTFRSIPTCVGFTLAVPPKSGARTVHPHVRGVYAINLSATFLTTGPSPRAWGLRLFPDQIHFVWRSIPTCVGFTFCLQTFIFRVTVHPHVRGVYAPPHPSAASPTRSIPTCVGFTFASASAWASITGPSPRAWGLQCSDHFDFSIVRSIPTCVGFTTGPASPGR